jgi:hypothetical protein
VRVLDPAGIGIQMTDTANPRMNVTVGGNKLLAALGLAPAFGDGDGERRQRKRIRLHTTGSASVPSVRRPNFAREGCPEVAEKLVVGTKGDHWG